MKSQVELLSPAGDKESLRFALAFGADAVYLGAKSFGMRAASANFDEEELNDAVQLAHSMDRKVYLTLNTTPVNTELDGVVDTMRMAENAGVDAMILADLGVLALAKKVAPNTEIHTSTQMGIMNYATANAAFDLGAKRVVLARELSLDEISEIRQKTPKELELEVFVHGAMCMSVSGRCLLSNYFTQRDANRGKCSQPCRWKYSIVEEKRPGQYCEIGENEEGSYILTADDLCAAPFLDKVIEAGATSLKIEGRAKSFYYAASTTAAYRAALDEALKEGPYVMPEFTKTEIEKISHRPYSPGFFLGRSGATQSVECGGYIRQWQLIGVVEEQKDGKIYCTQRGKFVLGEELEVLMPGGKSVAFTPEFIWDERGNETDSTARSKMNFSLPAIDGESLVPYSILRKKVME